MSGKGFKLGDRVTSVINDSKNGIVTGIYRRPGNKSYSVTWDDLIERNHFPMEIMATPFQNPAIGFVKK